MALVLHNAAEAAKRQPNKRKTPVPTVPGGEVLIEVQPTDAGREALQRLHKASNAPSLVTLAAHFPPSSAPCSTRDARLVADAAKALCRGATATHLRGLEVSGQVPSQCVDAVLSTLSLQPKQSVSCGLRYVTLESLALSAESTRLLCGSLGKCPASIISLRRCGLDDSCAIHVANLIRAHACQRDESAWARGLRLDASKRRLPGEGGLRAFDLTHNCLGDALCDHVASALSADQHLLALNLSHNRVTAKGAQHFASVLVDAPSEGNALLWLGLEGCKGFLSDAYAQTSKALEQRREKESTSSMAEADAAARQLIECWLRDATTTPPTELLIANSQKPPSPDDAAAELFARRVGTHAPSQRFRSPEELDACLRGVRVDVADARELRAADAAVRRAAKALRRDSDCDEWAASLASSDGCVSSAAVLSGLRVLLAGSPQALIDAAARRLDALAGQAPGVRVPATEYGQALREAAEHSGDQHAAARDDAVGAVLDAIDAYVKTKGRVGLFQDIAGKKRSASVADLRDFLSREGLGTVTIEAATDQQDELNFVSSSRARRGTKQSAKKARLPRDAEQGDLASYLVALAGAPKRLTATQLGAALIDAKRRASRALEVASQALAVRGVATSLQVDLEEWSRALDPDVTGKVSKATLIESLMSSQPALQAAGDPAKLAASLQADAILAFAGCDEADCQVDDVCRVLTESGDVGAKALRRVAHGAGACSVLEHARKNRWTISTLTRQLRGKKDAARAPPGCTRNELRSALRRWGLTTQEENCVDRFREMTTRKPIIVPPSPKKTVQKKKEPTVSNKKVTVLSLADVLTFARRVADDDAAAVSSTRLDDAVRRSRRRAATAAKLREGASDLEALRAELRDRGVELDAWLEAAERVVPLSGELHPSGTLSAPAALSAADLATGLSGLMRVSEAPAAARDALTSIVDRAVHALAAYAREPSDFPALELRELRAANARAAAVAKRARDDDKVSDAKLVDAASDRRDAVVFRVAEAIDAILERKKWRVADLLQAAVAFDDRGQDKCSPRALCRALRAWGLFRCRDAAEDADYARFIGEPRSISKPPPPPKRKDPFRRKKKVQPPPVEIPKPRRKTPRRKAPPSRRKPSAAQAAKDAEEADLLAQLECALVTMASKISHIESKLEGSST
ncbi:unnamed protein product [Pelagomonas calceolata]|uniref:Uncharacterized protein n=1 Tax=Pelagomonas calceolata TaxID=35677 RepID=A0A7S4A262_9STRA|nr:unnamed protein product [Pelagomonas calceolata]|mmetsp:Transcript_9084/g.26507  ORF Transcript_9084/g.26507 Transcript_9084/m.26507 type:complete len:1155 (+) Transcript_9084:161-3625(+)